MSSMHSDTATDSLTLPPEQRARADAYRLLGLLLAAPPNSDLLAILKDIDVGAGEQTQPWRELRTAASTAKISALEDEYQQLFIGLGRGELNPYASWYLTGFLMEKPLADLRTTLAQMGFNRLDHTSEPEDHAAALCETMALIIAEGSLSFEQGKEFFQTFLASWLQRFFKDLEAADSANFYRAVGRLGRKVMEIECQYYSMPV